MVYWQLTYNKINIILDLQSSKNNALYVNNKRV